MNICAPFIRRPVGTSLLAIGLFLAGVVAYRFMPVAAIPRVDFPMINGPCGVARRLTRRRSLPRWPRRWNGGMAQIAGVTRNHFRQHAWAVARSPSSSI